MGVFAVDSIGSWYKSVTGFCESGKEKQTNKQTNLGYDNYITPKCPTTRWNRTSDFHKLRGIYWLAEKLPASQEEQFSMKLFTQCFFQFLQSIWNFLYVTSLGDLNLGVATSIQNLWRFSVFYCPTFVFLSHAAEHLKIIWPLKVQSHLFATYTVTFTDCVVPVL